MESNLVRGMVFGLAGCVIGMSTGVAAMGGAVNGALVFGPIGFALGWLLPWPQSRNDGETTLDAPAASKAETIQPPKEKGDLQQVEKSFNEAIPIVGRMLAAVWNLQMKLLIGIGVMPFLQKYPWTMIAIAFALLALLFPLGIIFSVTGIAAMHYHAKPHNQFLANVNSPQG